jgi:enediyne biosynthesis thioesterase
VTVPVSPSFEYRHEVGFEETNVVGNVYFVNHLRWQGRCRELFLRRHAPGVLDALDGDLTLITLHASCHYLGELRAFDVVVVRMHLAELTRHRLELRFEYWRADGEGERLVARGEHGVACMRSTPDGLVACEVPGELARALQPYVPPPAGWA